MKYPILASFIVFLIFFTFDRKRRQKKENTLKEDYWERERLANSVRRKPLDNLNYIRIPLDELPMDMLAEIPEIQDFHKQLLSLSEKKIVNFTGFSNTDLKLEYGAPNINLLSEYDQNFTELVTLLQSWAAFLMRDYIISEIAHTSPERQVPENYSIPPLEERKSAAKTILEYAVSIGSDISASYEALLKLYREGNEPEKIKGLKTKAEELRSLSKGRILALLNAAEEEPDQET